MGFDKPIFLDQPLDENLLCPICFDVCEEATTACASGHTFCASCLRIGRGRDQNNTNVANNSKCPTCRADRAIAVNRPLRGIIEGLRVRCGEGRVAAPQKKTRRGVAPTKTTTEVGDSSKSQDNDETRGCEWEGTLGVWKDEHKQVCPYAFIRCPSKCGKRLPRKDLEQHNKKECPFRSVECSDCKETILHHKLESHQKGACPKTLVKCRFCHKEMTREILGKLGFCAQENFPNIDKTCSLHKCTGHYAECSKAKLNCEFYDHGCRAQFTREDAAAHHAENAQYHAALVNKTVQRLKDRFDWDRVKFVWQIKREKLVGVLEGDDVDVFIESTVLSNQSPYKLYLRLQLSGPDDPVEIAICSKGMNCRPYRLDITLKNIFIEVMDDCPVMELSYAEIELPHEVSVEPERRGGSDTIRPGVFKYSTTLEAMGEGDGEEEVEEREKLTRFKLMELIDRYQRDNLMIHAKFWVRKVDAVVVKCAD